MPTDRYPGRHIVTDRSKAVDIKFDQATPRPVSDLPCLAPVERHGIGLPSQYDKRERGPVPFTIAARCRRCENCRAHRQRLWAARAIDETKVASRTWFGTLTVNPHQRFKHLLAADLLKPSGVSSAKWPDLKFRILAANLGKEVTRMFKRLRKGGGEFRYLLVTENHKDDFPHFHLLLHETGDPITKRTLDANWPLGFCQWRLVDKADAKAVGYVCKYLSKDARTRVRASIRYGQAEKIRQYTAAAENAARVLSKNPENPPFEKEGKNHT